MRSIRLLASVAAVATFLSATGVSAQQAQFPVMADVEAILSMPSVLASQTASTTITFGLRNRSTTTATSGRVIFSLPAGVKVLSMSPACVKVADYYQCDIVNLPKNKSVTRTATVKIDPNACPMTSVIFSARADYLGVNDPNAGNNLVSKTVGVFCPTPSIGIFASVNGQPMAGPNITMRLGDTVSVSGTPQNLNGVYGFDYNAGWAYDGALGGSCTSTTTANPKGTWSMTCVPTSPGSGRLWTGFRTMKDGKEYKSNILTIKILPSAAPMTQCNDRIDNDRDGNVDFPMDKGCSSAQDQNEGDGEVNLTIDLLGSGIVTPGGTMTYAISARNQGPDNAAGISVRLNETIPSYLTLAPSDPRCTMQNGKLECKNVFALRANEKKSVIVNFTVSRDAPCTGVFSNKAILSETPQGLGPNGKDTSNILTTRVQCPTQAADLAVTTSAPASAVIGDMINYAITVTNAGPGAATNVVIKDVLPKGLQYITTAVLPSATISNDSNNVSCTENNGVLTCTVKNFAARGSLTFNVSLKVATSSNQQSSTPYCPSNIINTAIVGSSTSESNTSNNTSQTVTTRISCPVMSFSVNMTSDVTASGNPAAVNMKIGDVVNFTQRSVANGVINGAFQWNWNSAVLKCLGYPDFDSPVLRCTALSSGKTDVSITMFPIMADGSQRTVTSNVISVVVASATPAPSADVSISVPVYNNAVIRGDRAQVTLEAANAGPNAADNVSATLTMPDGFTLDTAKSPAGCSAQGKTVTCTVGQLAMGAKMQKMLFITSPAKTPCTEETVTFTAGAAGTTADPKMQNNSTPPVNIKLTCPAVPVALQLGDVNGDGKLSGLDSSMILAHAAGTKLIVEEARARADVDNDGLITATDADLLLKAVARSITLPARYGDLNSDLKIDSGDMLLLSQYISGAKMPDTSAKVLGDVYSDGKLDDNDANLLRQAILGTATIPMTPAPIADLSVSFSFGNASVNPDSTLNNTITIKNAGPATVTDIALTLSPSAGIRVIEGTAPSGTFLLASGEQKTFPVNFAIDRLPTCQSQLEIKAVIASKLFSDPDQRNNVATVPVQVLCPSSTPASTLSVQLTGSEQTKGGSLVGYRMIVTNDTGKTVQNGEAAFVVSKNRLTFMQMSADCKARPDQSTAELDVFSCPVNLMPGEKRAFDFSFTAPPAILCGNGNDITAYTLASAPNLASATPSAMTTKVTCPGVSPSPAASSMYMPAMNASY